MNKKSSTLNNIYKEAVKVRELAYSPYSGFKVGAALLDNKKQIHTGCNVENSTYGATVCAERNAIAKMISNGGKSIKEIVIVTPQGWLPCGICRQVLMEFTSNPEKVKVHIATPKNGINKTYVLSELLPSAFSRINLFSKKA